MPSPHHVTAEAAAAWAPRLLVARRVDLDRRWNYRSLAAPFWRCYLPMSAGGHLHFAGTRTSLQPNEGLIMTPETAAAARADGPFKKVFGHFSWEIHEPTVAPGIHPFPMPRPVQRGLQQIDANDPTGLALLVMEAIIAALRHLAPHFAATPNSYDPRVQRALQLIQARPAQPPDNDELARLVALHPNSFVRLFTTEVGCSPQRHSRRWRLRLAGHLLADGTASIKAIAEQCGFIDRHHLTRAFTRYWSCPPAEFRRRNQA